MADHKALIESAVGGDEEALSELLSAHAGPLRARLVGTIAPQWKTLVDEDDVLQVTFLEAFLRIATFENRGEGAFLAWLTRIAQNNLKDAIRGLQRAKRPDPRKRVGNGGNEESYVGLVEVIGMTLTTPSMHAAKGEMIRALDQALDRLPEDYRRVIRMYDLEGTPIEDVARELGRSAGAVYMLRARAHERLASELGGQSQFFSKSS